MRLIVFMSILFFSHNLIGQTFTESDIKKLANQSNEQIKGLDLGNGITARGCFSSGRTLIYQYEVPSYWESPPNFKDTVIENLKTSGAAKTYFLEKIDVDFYYYNNNSLIKKLSIKSNEFSTFNNELGGYLSIKDHEKSKDVNLKLKVPQGWEVKEGDRPNIVKKFIKDGNSYIILIKDNTTFFSRSQNQELLSDESFVNKLAEGFISSLNNPKVIDQSVVTVSTYPSLTFKATGSKERLGITSSVIMRCWIVFYEDKIVSLMSSGINNGEFRALEELYFLVTNSVIFPDQYN